jgi:hypothetical protein
MVVVHPVTRWLVVAVAAVLLSSATVEAAATLVWNANPPTDNVTSYEVGWRTSPTGTETIVTVGNTTQWVIVVPAPGTYHFRVYALNLTGRSGPSVTLTDTISPPGGDPPPPGPQAPPTLSRGSPFTVRINFQPVVAPVPGGYQADGGAVFGPRGAGLSYGWTTDNTGQARDRDSPLSPDQRYDTFNQFQRPANPDAVWELALPNGTYQVRLVAGDPGFTDSVHQVLAEGVLVLSGTPTDEQRWIDRTGLVTVTDGRLTVRAAPTGVNSKVCFVEIVAQ